MRKRNYLQAHSMLHPPVGRAGEFCWKIPQVFLRGCALDYGRAVSGRQSSMVDALVQCCQGLHTVVGYWTIMSIDDDVTGAYAVRLRFRAPVVSAWFNATTSAAGYQANPSSISGSRTN